MFFIVNYIMGVAVILNLVVTVVINSFWDEYNNSETPSLALRQLHDAAAASAHHAAANASNNNNGNNGNIGHCVGRSSSDLDSIGPAGSYGVETREATTLSMSSTANSGFGQWWGWPEGTSRDYNVPGERDWEGGARVAGEENVDLGTAVVGGGGNVGAHRSWLPRHRHALAHGSQSSMSDGDQQGMAQERAIARRASRRRLDVSGIT